jgi:ubiquitin C-terminal hydrolase
VLTSPKANSIISDLTKTPPALQRGFDNFTGVLCYRISLVQALLHIPKLVTLLWDNHLPTLCVVDDRNDCSACALRSLVIAYWKVQNSSTLLALFRNLHSLLKRRGWTEMGQGDPNEQLTFLFRILREDLPVATYSEIDSLFSSSINQSIPCACGHSSITTSSQTQMTVCLAPQLRNGTLQQYIARGVTDTVDYQCEACKKNGQCKKTRLFDDLSEILAIHLSRRDAFGRKIKTTVNVSPTLDLTLLKSKSRTDNERWKYELISVIQHSGGDNSGHYICSAEGPDKQWRMFNDRSVSRTEVGAVERSFSPVMCFYRRVR